MISFEEAKCQLRAPLAGALRAFLEEEPALRNLKPEVFLVNDHLLMEFPRANCTFSLHMANDKVVYGLLVDAETEEQRYHKSQNRQEIFEMLLRLHKQRVA